MSKKSERNTIVALDIGTSKVVAMVGEVNENGRLEVVGIGTSPSRGMRRGVVVNIESTIQSIQKAVEEAELMSGVRISSVYVGIAGSHVRSLNSHGIVAIKEKEVTSQDLERVMDAARAVAIPADQRILHVLPQEYVIDTQEGIREPVGMSGVRLEARVHLVTAAHGAAQNIIKCVERCGLSVEDIILEQVASSYAVLEEDEKELGVCLVDIGGGTTEVAVFSMGGVVVRRSVRVAGDEMDEDIVQYVRSKYNLLIGERTAERAKMSIGSAFALPEERTMTLRGRNLINGLPQAVEISSIELREAMSPAINMIVDTVKDAIDETPPELVADLMETGVCLAGGGAQIRGLADRLEDAIKMRVWVAEDPMTCVARGAGRVLENFEYYRRILADDDRSRRI